jgi:hypothetical protein
MPPVHPPLKNDGPACRVCGWYRKKEVDAAG